MRDGPGLVLSPTGKLGVSADGGQWRPELVRGVRDELPDPRLRSVPRRQGAGDVPEHLIDGRTHGTDLGARIGVLLRNPDGQVDVTLVQRQGGDLTGRRGHPLQWPDGPADENE